MSAIFYFLVEDITGVAFARNVENLGNFVLNPFMHFRLVEFKMVFPLGSEVASPVNHGLVIVVEHGGGINIRKRNVNFYKSFEKISDANSKFDAFVS